MERAARARVAAPQRWRRALPGLAGGLALVTLVLALHGPALGYGLFMDDYAHARQLRESDWSWRGLTDACRLELIGGVVELWWLPDVTLRFFRPVAFGLMKLIYVLADWSPVAMHAASLGWHVAACLLLALLLRRLGTPRLIAWWVAALFGLHPAHVATVQWIACQTELMVTVFLLGATLCFGRYRGWPGFAHAPPAAGAAAPRRWTWLGGALLLFALALGCRENAVVLPLVLLAVEAHSPRGRRRAVFAYVLLGIVIAAYLMLRQSALGGVAVPPRPYVIPPTAPDFLRFVVDKALYYLLGEFLLFPCVPIGGLPYVQARPLLFYPLAGAVVALCAGLAWRFRREPAAPLALAWLLGFMAPLLPVFASPHHLYLPGIGWAILVALLARAVRSRSAAAARRALVGAGATLCLAVFITWTYFSTLIFSTGVRVEDGLVAELAAAPSGLRDGDVLYIANLPPIGHYVQLALEARTGRRGLRVVPLTWAPRLLGLASPAEVTPVDDRTVDVRVRGDRYFAGPLGALVRETTGADLPDEVDRRADLGLRVRVLARDAAGISALRFEFTRPLTAAGQHVFWGSRVRWAAELPRAVE